MLTEELHERINKLSHVKRQLLHQQLGRQRAAHAASTPVAHGAAPATPTLLSHTQHMIWRTQALHPAAHFYTHPQVFHLAGRLDPAALAAAFQHLVARHDVLRTRIALFPGIPPSLASGMSQPPPPAASPFLLPAASPFPPPAASPFPPPAASPFLPPAASPFLPPAACLPTVPNPAPGAEAKNPRGPFAGTPYAIVGGESTACDLHHLLLPGASPSSPLLDSILQPHARRTFSLADDLPLSVQVIQVAPEEHYLSIAHHFVAFDHWSLALFNRELGQCYDSIIAGATPHLPPLPYTYADYALWQRSPEHAHYLADLSHFWRWQLAAHPALTAAAAAPSAAAAAPSATDSAYTAGALLSAATFAADSFEFCLPAPMLHRLELLAQRENATLFMLLLASLQTLLARYTQRTEIAVGTVVANRPSMDAESLLGNFSNRLLLRGNLAGNPTFRQLLRRVRGSTLNAYARQDVPLDLVAAELHPAGTLPAGQLFPVMLDYINEPLPLPSLRGLNVARLPFQVNETEYPLHVTVQRSRDHLRVRLQVRADFEVRTTVPHIAYNWNTLLSAIAGDPDQRIANLPLTRQLNRRPPSSGWAAPAYSLSKTTAARL